MSRSFAVPEIGPLAALAAAACLLPAGPVAAQGSLEYPVKAAFLYKFGSFVTWPPSAFASDGAPVTVCVLGRDPFGPTLDRLARDATVNGRRVAVKRMDAVTAGHGCHILYLGGERAGDGLSAVQGAPVLTVSDEAQGGPRGVIHFVLQDGKVRFRADTAAAARQRIQISSRLLNLAVGVTAR